MKVKKNIATSEEGFVFNPSTGDSFSTNPIGSEIITMLKKENSSKEVIDYICDKYDVDKSVFERDFEDFTLQLKEFCILD